MKLPFYVVRAPFWVLELGLNGAAIQEAQRFLQGSNSEMLLVGGNLNLPKGSFR